VARRRKTGGRKKGTPNKATREVKQAAARLVEDRTYRANLRKRLQRGEAAPAVEVMLWHYAYGQPTKKVELEGKLSLEELVAGSSREEQ
jgi:hypothetical protein